jgi:hypothetical protein
LQYGCALIFAQTCEQDHLPIREFKRIVVRHDIVHVYLPKAREPLGDLLVRQNADAERRLAFDVLLKRDFGYREADTPLRLVRRPRRNRA